MRAAAVGRFEEGLTTGAASAPFAVPRAAVWPSESPALERS